MSPPEIPERDSAVITHGNRFSAKEKHCRIKQLKKEISRGWVDKELIPYLEKINKFPFVVTTQSCCGHDEKDGRRAHIDFRSALSEADTINKILRPLEFKRNPPDIAMQIMIEPYGIRYCLWFQNNRWRDSLEDFIKVLNDVSSSENSS